MNLFSKKTLVTGTSIALLTATFALSPANISKTDNGINLSIWFFFFYTHTGGI